MTSVAPVVDSFSKQGGALVAKDASEDVLTYIGTIKLSQSYAQNKHIANKLLFAQQRDYKTLLLSYGLVISNHTFDTLYAIVIRARETDKKEAPVYAIPHGGRVNIPKTLLDFDDHVLFIGLMERTHMVGTMSTHNLDLAGTGLLAITTYLKLSTFQKTDNPVPYVQGSKTVKPKLSSFLAPSTSALVGKTSAKDGAL